MDKSDRTARTRYNLYIRDGSATFYFRNGLYRPLVNSLETNAPRSCDPRNPPAELLG